MSSTEGREDNMDAGASGEVAPPKQRGRAEPLMRNRLRTLVVASIVLVAGLSALVVLAPSSETAVICVILPAEDSPLSHTPEIKSAMTMAVDELNHWGGIGNTEMELVIVETKVDPDAVASMFERLERDVRPLAYTTISCELLTLLAPLAEAAEAPLLGFASAPGLMEGYEWSYRYCVSSELEANSTIRILEMLEVGSLGVLYSSSPHGCGLNALLVEEFTAAGGTVKSQACDVDDTDFTDEIEALSDSEAIFAVARCGVMVAMLSALNESGYDGYMMASSCASSPRLREALPQGRVFVSSPILYKTENILAIEFTKKFTEEFAIPYSHHAAVSYDIVHLVHDLLEGHGLTRDILRQQLANDFVFSGVMGNLRIEAGTHDFLIPVYPSFVMEGELSYL